MRGRMKRIISFVLFLCIVATLLPPVQVTRAAEVTQRYVLDTDGIDPGATYLIVNTASAGTGNALRFYYQNSRTRDFRNQTLTVKQEDGVAYIDSGFTNEADCQFQFSSASAGNITHGEYSVNLSESSYVSGNPSNTLTFTNAGNGQYRIHYTSWWRTYYLHYSNSDWASSTTTTSVYLFKLTEYVVGYDVTFDGNGHTSGTLPEDALMLSAGEEYTVPHPAGLRKDIGEDTWLFQCWNTEPDGSGTEYAPGETITVTEDLKLYADWYQQTKHTISMVTYLDGVATDVSKFAGYDRHFYAQLEGGDGTLIPMTRREEGVYSAKVVDNGTYIIYAQTISGSYEPVHGHKIIVYNQTGITECLHYSITYNTDGGVWAEGEDPGAGRCHDGETVYASVNVPAKEGYRFIGWQYQDSVIHPGHPVTESANQKIEITALWEELVDITVNVVIDHNDEKGGTNNDNSKHDVTILLLREENGVNLPVEERVLTTGYTYDEEKNTTTYQVVFQNMPQGIYRATGTKPAYVETVTLGENEVDLNLKYTPENYDLTFAVRVNAENEEEKALMPKAVNVKVSYWGHNSENELGWHILTKQGGDKPPSTVLLDENGCGTAFFNVWPKRSGSDLPYEFRVEVTSFVLPDDTIVPASGNLVTYTPDGSGLYTATVDIDGEGRVPEFPEGSNTELEGAYFDGSQQMGVPTVTVEIDPMTVTFDAGNGKVNGKDKIVLEDQYRYPALHDYVAVPNEEGRQFVCWIDENGDPVENMEDQLLPGNVVYTARYNENITLSGIVAADAVYEEDGRVLQIAETDRVKKAWVVLQKRVGDVYNDVDSAVVELTYQSVDGYNHLVGLGAYEFTDIPNDGTEYRVFILVLNYNAKFDNNADGVYTEPERAVPVDPMNPTAQVNIHLDLAAETYQQEIRIDASQIQKDLRPTAATVRMLYRDLGDVHNYNVASRHKDGGITVQLDPNTASGAVIDENWNTHTNGAPYEYQVEVTTVYGNNVTGAYMKEGTPYTASCPYTISYGPANNYLKQNLEGGVLLEATLVPKTYLVNLDLNLGEDNDTPVFGLEDFMVDDGSGNDRYAFVHTWSFADEFVAYPYREGYVFTGWESPDTDEVYIQDGIIHVGSTLANEITLKATWKPLKGTDYSIRYLELNTDKVLHGAQAVENAELGNTVVAADNVLEIEGYKYVGAMVDGMYMVKEDNPYMTVTDDPVKNLMVIYYLPDGSDGYTEQVESNLEINKTAVLENDGTYTITMETFTKDNPITTLIQQNTPLDIVMVLDQSGSMYTGGALDDLRSSAEDFISLIASHGRTNEVNHRIAIVGYASDQYGGYTSYSYPTAGKDGNQWVNTGVFDSNGDFHIYPVTGFNYTEYTGLMTPDGTYYTYADGDYLLLTYHEQYRHLITEEEARVESLNGTQILGYTDGQFVELTRNSSGLWLYGDKLLYSRKEFFTYHTDVWTHRHGLERREIHAYGVGADYTVVGAHSGVFTRTETREADPQLSIYQDALVPVSLGAYGSGGVTPGLAKATGNIGGNGLTYVSYGMEMANSIFAANPLDPQEGRVRILLVFTDGKPGDGSNFDEAEANKAMELSYIASDTYGADVYTVGLYGDDVVAAESDQDFFLKGMSSDYPDARTMDDVWQSATYKQAESGYRLDRGGPYYASEDGSYYLLTRKSVYENRQYYTQWGFTNSSGQFVSVYKGPTADGHPAITNGKVGDYDIYRKYGDGYQTAAASGHSAVAFDPENLARYFAGVVESITTKITTQIILHEDTILRDIIGEGLVLTPGAVVTAYKEQGVVENGRIVWSGKLEPVASATVPLENIPAQVNSAEVTDMQYTLPNGTPVVKENVPYIQIYNLDVENPTDSDKANYHPHTIDVTGYDFEEWYISDQHPQGYKMVIKVTGIEATNDVAWGVSSVTNYEQSGLWLPADEYGNRQLLLPFHQPTTIFVERAYVLDYGKEFTLSGWYFDDEDGKDATPVHIDCDIGNGMNRFDPADPTTANAKTGGIGNTKYGNVQIKDGKVTYSPTSMSWGGYDQFYVFGNTWRKTVLAQDANKNGNLWNKVTVIPANNIYFEDSFVTTESTTQNGIEGFAFTGQWSVVGTDDGNTETPEHMEAQPYGDVHGWTDSLSDDDQYTDGTAHKTDAMGAKAEFTFTGTGVEVYTSTSSQSGMVVAALYRNVKGADGNMTSQFYQSQAVDNYSKSGEYYHIPTVSFSELPYGTYKLELYATMAQTEDTGTRCQYYIDGVRVYNPLGNTANYQSDIVKYAYGMETNAVFTEVRDILLDYGSFSADVSSIEGAVFIDWIKEGQAGSEQDETKAPAYEVGTFEAYGPKNEVYLAAGQAIVLKVAEGNNYYVGLKSLKGDEVSVNVSGIDRDDPTVIKLSHTTDMYYQVTPVGGYIVIQNGNEDDAVLSITNLRTTNLTTTPVNGGILPVAKEEAVEQMSDFSAYMLEREAAEENIPQPSDPEEVIPSAEEQAQANLLVANALFTSVRQWLDTEEEESL